MAMVLTDSMLLWSAMILFVLSALWYLTKSVWGPSNSINKIVLKDPFPITEKSHLLPGPERIRYSIFAKNEKEMIETDDPNIQTLYDNFLHGMKISNNGECLGHRDGENGPYKFITYGETLQRAHNFGAGLKSIGLQTGDQQFIGIYSQNRAEWDISSLACMSYSLPIIPLYDSLGAEAVSFIVNQATIEVIICDGAAKLKKLLDNAPTMPSLKHIVVMDWIKDQSDNGLNAAAADLSIKIHGFQDLIDIGQKNPVPLKPASRNDTYIICYTSGTTGKPKGVMISHKNLVSQTATSKNIFGLYGIQWNVGEGIISYLPMAHMFEQLMHAVAFSYGVKLGYFGGNINKLLDDVKALKPTYFPIVPRLLNRLYDKVQQGLSGGRLKRLIFDIAFKSKLTEMRKGIVRKDSIWDTIIFSKIQKELGGNVRLMATGSAPISEEVLTMSRVMLGAVILEAYGQTEATAYTTLTLPTDTIAGHVGGVAPNSHMKLVDVPELKYYAAEDKGEICIRGPCVMSGYFMEPEMTAEVIDSEGWLHTGDIGMWLPDGTLKVIDRKKHIFKLAQGEYVAPEKIESIYSRCPVVSQIFVDGNSLQRYLVAVVVPDEFAVNRWAQENDISEKDFTKLCARSDVKKMVLSELEKIGKQNQLNSIEQVKAIHVCSEPFTMENGLLTPTMKSKRNVLHKRYTPKVEELYKSNVQ